MGNESSGSRRSRSMTTAGVDTRGGGACRRLHDRLSERLGIRRRLGGRSAVLRDVGGNKVGKVKFEGDEHGTVVKATMNGVTVGLDGYHGFHLHANDAGGPMRPWRRRPGRSRMSVVTGTRR